MYHQTKNVEINFVVFIGIQRYLLNIPDLVDFIILIKLFHKTATAYLRDLIPNLIGFYMRDEDAPLW